MQEQVFAEREVAAPAVPGPVLVRETGELLVVELHGELDLAVECLVRVRLDGVVRRVVGTCVVDLRAVTFFDTTCLAQVFRLRRRVLAAGSGFAVVCADAGALRQLRMHDVLEVLRPGATMEEAVERAVRGVRPV
ncbi:STAS domain-containing protein [Streptomyces sp. NPDC051561]|uniref:STAS domain-containing protein n=1 Tax=Streptomyces sp. NPDC051561 TaxID=3365658 RepID=UPI0037903D88